MTATLTDDSWDPAPDPLTRRGVLVLRTRQQRERRTLMIACAIAAAGLIAAVMVGYFVSEADGTIDSSIEGRGPVGRMMLPAPVTDSAAIYDTEVMPLAAEEASAINAERPVDIARVIPAAALRIAAESASGTGYAAALRCLTQAVFYEAASEPDEGQRGVAQVVLNRVRHPAFPNTVCGVVFQGSERVTGCQFSFTCDGSLARTPSVSGWARAERVARAALGGRVAASVGNATHYHANYVVPYWAPTLDKAATIGAHIFYLMRGFLGSPRAFRDRYDIALEAPPLPELGVLDELGGEQSGLFDPLPAPETGLMPNFQGPVEDARSGNLIPGAAAAELGLKAPTTLRADERRGELRSGGSGTLKADEGKPANAPPAEATDPGAS
jgi:spore germination cell wall hydrolase CwlJ-like protein